MANATASVLLADAAVALVTLADSIVDSNVYGSGTYGAGLYGAEGAAVTLTDGAVGTIILADAPAP